MTGAMIPSSLFASKAFFSFAQIPDHTMHRRYNEWHQLDHRPENLRLPSVVWGERWVRSPDCTAAQSTQPDALLTDLHYLNMYWLRDPVDEAVAQWNELAERSFHWGRRDDIHIARRLLMEFFRPVKGYVSPRVLVSAEALPFRPTRGIYVTVSRVDEPRSREAELLFRWYDREAIPAWLESPGVAGAWTFASESTFVTSLDLSGGAPPVSTRITLLYLDEDPVEMAPALDRIAGGAETAGVEDVLFQGPLRTIIPWEWDWFDHDDS
jgi:hypothetical protein